MGNGNFRRFVRIFVFSAIAFWIVIICSGCTSEPQPRLRFGAFFGSPAGMYFPDPEKLGKHQYAVSITENNGMIYTCRGGFIDIGHLREAADRTKYAAVIVNRNLMQEKKKFSFRVIEPSRYVVKVSYPSDWQLRSKEEKEEIVNDVSIHLGQYVAHTSLIWHEILTWYGFTVTGVFSEKISSFSWEDTYSDILGATLAVRALRGDQEKFDDSMTTLINQELELLGVQPAKVAYKAAKQIEGDWFTGGFYFFVEMKKRNFDIGLDDGSITPVLVPDICPNASSKSYPVPNMDFLFRHGFNIELEIEPRVWEQGRIYRSIGLKKNKDLISPGVHFPKIMEQIKKQANQMKGRENVLQKER